MRILVTGGSGVLGKALLPRLASAGHAVLAPGRALLDLFDRRAVARAVADADAVYHLATRIPPPQRQADPSAWEENDRLRADASGLLVDAALASGVAVYVQPTVTFVYPATGPVDETTPPVPGVLASALVAEGNTARFAQSGRRGIVLRLGLLDGPGTWSDHPDPRFGATLHVDDAGAALFAALDVPSGIYNVCRDGERVANAAFKAAADWAPTR